MTDRMEPKHKLTVKVGDALRTIQGYTLEEYLEARTELLSELAGDAEAVALARAAGSAAPLIAASAPTVASAPPGALADNPWPAAPAAFTAAAASTEAPNCAHGPRNALSKVGQYGLWKGWMCPTPKGTPDQCKPVYLNAPGKAGHNPTEWNSFPA
jgi:hypothetical protein